MGVLEMKGYILDYINENEYKKLERALKKYNMLAFKELNFSFYPALRNGNFLGELVSKNKAKGTETYENLRVIICLVKFTVILNYITLFIKKRMLLC